MTKIELYKSKMQIIIIIRFFYLLFLEKATSSLGFISVIQIP